MRRSSILVTTFAASFLLGGCDTTSGGGGSSPEENTVAWNEKVTYGTLVDARDGRSYRTVRIGSQRWMAEDLAYDTAVAAKSNRFPRHAPLSWGYHWSTAMGLPSVFDSAVRPSTGLERGLCPEGWHLPDSSEWETLFAAVGGVSIAGKALKAMSGWHNDGNGSDTFGFRILSAAEQYGPDNKFIGSSSGYWTSSTDVAPSMKDYATGVVFESWHDSVTTTLATRKGYLSVRCVAD